MWPSKRWRNRLALFAMVVGPGIITANVDNDAGGIATYSAAGARFGLNILWILPPIGVLSGMILWMCSKMAIVTGKGLSGLVRERFGLQVSFYLMLALIATNVCNSVANFSGMAAGIELFGISRFLAVPFGAFLVWRAVVKGTYHSVERLFFIACFFYLTYVISGFIAGPEWGEVFERTLAPRIEWSGNYFYAIVGITGATIAPWMLFYQQASTVEKGIPLKHHGYARLDVVIGAVMAMIVQYFIVLTCATTLHPHGIAVDSAEQAAKALEPFAGRHCSTLFALGLIMASTFGATILPISSATSVCEAMGWEAGLNRKFAEAPHYYVTFTLVIAIGAVVALASRHERLIGIMVFSQVVNGLLLPVVLYFTLRVCSDRRVMGEQANSRIFNILAWLAVAVVAAMSLTMVALLILHGG